VEDLERKFSRLDNNYLEQSLRMRTATHPKIGLLDHAVIVYELKKDEIKPTTIQSPPPSVAPAGTSPTAGSTSVAPSSSTTGTPIGNSTKSN